MNAGNEKRETDFCLENARRGIKEFLLKYSAPTSLSLKAAPLDKFVTIISVQSGSEGEAEVRQFLENSEWLGRVVVVTDQDNEHFDAMCASNVGISYEGQMISSAAALHLPTMALVDMRLHEHYWNDFFNRNWCDINIYANRKVYPEYIGGEAWYGKITDTMAEWYLRPETRFDMIKEYDGCIQDMMCHAEKDRKVLKTREIMVGSSEYFHVKDPYVTAASKIWSDM